MWQNGSNFAGGDSGDIDGDSSIKPKSTEEQENPVADDAGPENTEERGDPVPDVAADGGGSFISTQVRQQDRNTEPGIRIGKISRRRLKKYRGVSRIHGKWVARAFNMTDDEKNKDFYIGSFPTAEMAAIAYDAAVFHSRGASSFKRLNFPHYVSAIKSIVEGCSPSEATDFRCVARKAATELAPLISQEQKHEGLEASSLISQEQKHEALEVSAAMSAVITGTSDSTHNADFLVIPLQAKKRRKETPVPAAGIVSTRSDQLPAEIHDNEPDTMNNINQQIQHAQPGSSTSAAADSGITSFSSLIHESLHHNISQQIEHGQRSSSTPAAVDGGISSFSLIHEPLRHNINQQIQYGQPRSSTPAAVASGISSFLLIHEPLHHNINQQIQQGKFRSSTSGGVDSGISNFSLMHEPLHHNINQQIQHAQPRSSTSAGADSGISCFSLMQDHLHHNINQQIQQGKPRSITSAAADRGISSFSLMHQPLRQCSIAADTPQDAVIPTSNPNSVAVEMESSGGLVDVEGDPT